MVPSFQKPETMYKKGFQNSKLKSADEIITHERTDFEGYLSNEKEDCSIENTPSFRASSRALTTIGSPHLIKALTSNYTHQYKKEEHWVKGLGSLFS